MSSVKVNLLPPELAEKIRERRLIAASAAGVLVFVLVLGGLYSLETSALSRTKAERDAELAQIEVLESRLAELEPYRELAAQLDARNEVLAAAMATEISWATVFNNLSLTFPTDSSLVALTANAMPADPEPGEIDFGQAIGDVSFEGYSVDRYAPGVEGMLVQFDKVDTFTNIYLSVASREDRGTTEVTGFEGNAMLNQGAYTNRYDEGLPEDLR